MSDEQLFTFSPEPEPENGAAESSEWVVLSVEDDLGYQQSLKLGLNGLKVRGRALKFLTANSAAEASTILAEREDIAVILLDVVMEKDNAGLFLVNTIRTVLGNARVRIILLTGQPGMAPRQDTFKEYDIDEYWNKVELTEEKLRGIVSSNIKTWSNLNELYIAKRGLQMIVDASRAITSKQDVGEFTYTVLQEVSRVIGIPETGGVVCAYRPTMASMEQCEVVASSGDFSRSQAAMLSHLLREHEADSNPALLNAIDAALHTHEHQFLESWSVLYFNTADVDNNHYLVIVRSPKPLEQSHITLLMVYSENIGNGFVNLALLNKLSMLAYFDDTLNIPNKHWLHREITNMSEADLTSTSLVLLNMLDFSTNEITLGSEFSQILLRACLKEIKRHCEQAMTICYLGDGFFALLYRSEQVPDDGLLSALLELSVYIDNGEQRIRNRVSYVAIQDLDLCDLRKSLKTAQLVHNTWQRRDHAVRAISKSVMDEMGTRHKLLKSLSDAIADSHPFFLVFQPKVDLKSGQTTGLEALIRWRINDDEILLPNVFIPLAEASGLITRLDSLVMELAVYAAKLLHDAGHNFSVAFNVTHADVMSPGFIPMLEQTLATHDVKPNQVEIEITETQAMEDYDDINPVLNALLEMGIKVSIDDFGTGYSSLAHLSTLSASTLKVDKRFVDTLESDVPSSQNHILDMVQSLSKQCHFQVVAEGIETENQRQVLLEKGYSTGQGFLFAKPMPLPVLIDWLNGQRR